MVSHPFAKKALVWQVLIQRGRQDYKLIPERQNELWAGDVFPLGIMQDKVGPDIEFFFVLFVFRIMTISRSEMRLQIEIQHCIVPLNHCQHISDPSAHLGFQWQFSCCILWGCRHRNTSVNVFFFPHYWLLPSKFSSSSPHLKVYFLFFAYLTLPLTISQRILRILSSKISQYVFLPNRKP